MKPKRTEDKKLLEQVRLRRCLACGRAPVDAAHVRSKGSGGHDAHFNVIPLCRIHHSEQHSQGWQSFCDKYRTVWEELRHKGWYWDESRLHHPLFHGEATDDPDDSQTLTPYF